MPMKIGSKEPRLKRDISLFEAVIYGVGIILGAGIYALIGRTVGVAGNATWIAFLIAAAIAAMTGLSYAELASTFPKSAAEYTYVKEAFPNQKSLSFIVGWILIFSGLFTAATVALGFGGYFIGLLAPAGSIIVVAIVLIVILSFVNFAGIEESTKVNIVFTFIEAGGVVFIIVLGFMNFGSVNYFEFTGTGSIDVIFGLLSAAALIFFAYIGFEDIANMAEETEEPKKTIPRALLLSIVITTILYVLMALAVVSTGIPLATLAASDNPLALIAGTFLGYGGALAMAIIALFATANTVLIVCIVTSRMLYGMASAGALPKVFSKVHKKTNTPWVAIVFTGILSIAFVFFGYFPGEIEFVARATVFSVFLTFFIVNVILIYLRKSRPELERPFKVRPNVKWVPIFPLIGAVTCFLMLFSFAMEGTSTYIWILIIQGIIIGAGFLVYLLMKLATRLRRKEDISL